jgi:hypothetical protein
VSLPSGCEGRPPLLSAAWPPGCPGQHTSLGDGSLSCLLDLPASSSLGDHPALLHQLIPNLCSLEPALPQGHHHPRSGPHRQDPLLPGVATIGSQVGCGTGVGHHHLNRLGLGHQVLSWSPGPPRPSGQDLQGSQGWPPFLHPSPLVLHLYLPYFPFHVC